MVKHRRDNDENGYWPKPIPKENYEGGGEGKHGTGQQEEQEEQEDDRDDDK